MSYTDPDTGLLVLTKQPYEERVLEIDLVDVLASGDTVASVTSLAAAVVSPGTGTVTITSPVASGTKVQGKFADGTDDENYRIKLRVVTTNGDLIEGDAMLYVRDL
ncbi:MAG: hypothetical protein DIZ78_09385 [endosymbiont of Escarpia spicata]|uniref:Uncharacterized protein n=1 Tax=endosymbiont of Escarpia spicata TaxID=2200908 RepID=A0A370DN72_9GAMM|nr:MAG: hypothetical protein DIZ78_09385 [endosymbiont of Escarpia spicata]